ITALADLGVIRIECPDDLDAMKDAGPGAIPNGRPKPVRDQAAPAGDDGLGTVAAPLLEVDRPARGRQAAEGIADLAEAIVGSRPDQAGTPGGQQAAGRPAYGLVGEGAADGLVEDREIGVDPDQGGVASEESRAELVERPDRRRIQAAEDGPPPRRV